MSHPGRWCLLDGLAQLCRHSPHPNPFQFSHAAVGHDFTCNLGGGVRDGYPQLRCRFADGLPRVSLELEKAGLLPPCPPWPWRPFFTSRQRAASADRCLCTALPPQASRTHGTSQFPPPREFQHSVVWRTRHLQLSREPYVQVSSHHCPRCGAGFRLLPSCHAAAGLGLFAVVRANLAVRAMPPRRILHSSSFGAFRAPFTKKSTWVIVKMAPKTGGGFQDQPCAGRPSERSAPEPSLGLCMGSAASFSAPFAWSVLSGRLSLLFFRFLFLSARVPCLCWWFLVALSRRWVAEGEMLWVRSASLKFSVPSVTAIPGEVRIVFLLITDCSFSAVTLPAACIAIAALVHRKSRRGQLSLWCRLTLDRLGFDRGDCVWVLSR